MKPLHDKLEDLLFEAKASIGASETHGLQCGILCTSDTVTPHHLLELQLKELDCLPNEMLKTLLQDTCHMTMQSLLDPDFSFHPLLPADEDDFATRLTCVADWCRGFLYGLGLVSAAKMLKDEPIAELMRDLIKISQISFSPEEDGTEEDEMNYIELVEYIRVAVQTIYNELKTHDVHGSTTLH